LTNVQGISSLASIGHTPVGDPDGDGDSQRISAAGQLFTKLEQLKQQDPAKLKQVLTQIANQLNTASQQAQGSQAQFLSQLATRFQNAAQTGDITQLQPQHAHGHHRHAAQQAYAQNQQSPQQLLLDALQSTSQQPASASTIQNVLSGVLG
jgi:hypothetical protein